jgi:hypothetical protein
MSCALFCTAMKMKELEGRFAHIEKYRAEGFWAAAMGGCETHHRIARLVLIRQL